MHSVSETRIGLADGTYFGVWRGCRVRVVIGFDKKEITFSFDVVRNAGTYEIPVVVTVLDNVAIVEEA